MRWGIRWSNFVIETITQPGVFNAWKSGCAQWQLCCGERRKYWLTSVAGSMKAVKVAIWMMMTSSRASAVGLHVGSREAGFIASEPCMAEFMTDIPHINETLRRSSINTGLCAPLNGATTATTDCGSGVGAGHGAGIQRRVNKTPTVNGDTSASRQTPSVKVHEYAWMKEKKPSRRPAPAPGSCTLGVQPGPVGAGGQPRAAGGQLAGAHHTAGQTVNGLGN